MEHTANILIVEDELSLLKANQKFFEEQHYTVYAADTLSKARELFEENVPDLIILDVMLPDGTGFEFCNEVRASSNIPVIFLTALDNIRDEEQGFALGGDDYLIKPVDLNRLNIRVAAMLRRNMEVSHGRVEIPPLSLDPSTGICILEGNEISLSPMEQKLLYYFMKNPNKMISRDKVYEDVWNTAVLDGAPTVVEHVYRLRKKLGTINPDSYFNIASANREYMFTKVRY